MTSLKEMQETFQRAVVEGDDAVLAELVDTSKEKRDVLLGVYRNAYVLRLIEFLMGDYEMVHTLVGDEQFGDLARAYIAAHPSRQPNARWFGMHLPEFLRATEPYSGTPVVADVAALERALNDAFDAAEADMLTMDDFGRIAPEDWGTLTFIPHPSVRRLDLASNAADIWRALRAGETPSEPETLDEPCRVIVYREDTKPAYRVLAPDEAMMWDEAANGVRFSVLCEMLAAFAGADEAPARAAAYLRCWIETGMLRKPAG